MLAKERQKIIEKMLSESGAVLVSQLMERFDVSIETVRRDLLTMESEEKLVRVHGGAVVKGYMMPPRSFDERHKDKGNEKEALAAEAALYVQDGSVIGIDEGSTAIAFAKALKNRALRLTVVTHSLYVFEELSEAEGIEVILLGGHFNRAARALVGDLTARMLSDLHLDACFIFPSAVSLDFGVSCHGIELIAVERAMIASSDTVYVLADSSKFEKKAFYKLCDISENHVLVTDGAISSELVRLYRENGKIIRIGEMDRGK